MNKLTFDTILAEASSRGKIVTDPDAMKHALFQVISQNASPQMLLSEVNEFSDSTSTSKVDVLLRSVEDEAVSTLPHVSMATAVTMANQVKGILSDATSDLLLTENQRKQFVILVSAISSMIQKGNFHKNAFCKMINREMVLPMEAVHRLHAANIVSLDAFMTCNISKPGVIGGLSTNIVHLCQADKTNKSQRLQVIQGIMTRLISLAYGDLPSGGATAKGLNKVSVALLDSITKKILNNLAERSLDINVYTAVMAAPPIVDFLALKKFCSRQIQILLINNPVIKVSVALQQQANWTFAKSNTFIKEAFAQLLTMSDVSEAVTLLGQILNHGDEVNWQTVLTYCSSVLIFYQGAPPAVLELIRSLLQRALEENQQEGLIAGFLLARQACGEGAHVFQPYQDWFSVTFGDANSSLASNKRSFCFLMKFLTDIVPFEAAKFLKVHLMKPPFIPPKCREVFSDYATLARTRLQDLKESVEETGLHSTDSSSKSELEEQTRLDVERALVAFDRTGRVPVSVMEASIFRKPYFISKFLPTLMIPRPLPDSQDVKMKFIEALLQADKIPQTMYVSYQNDCQKMSAQLLEGVFSDEEDDMDEMLLSPWQQLQACVASLQTFLTTSDPDNTSSLASHLANLSEKILNYLPHVPPGDIPGQQPTDSSTEAANLRLWKCPKEYSQVIGEIYGLLAALCVRSMRTESASSWCLELLIVLTSHAQLWHALCLQTLTNITSITDKRDTDQTRSLAVILLHLFTYPKLLPAPPLQLDGLSQSYTNYLISMLTPGCRHWNFFLWRLSYDYIHALLVEFLSVRVHYVEVQDAYIPPSVASLFLFLSERLLPSLHQCTCTEMSYMSEVTTIWPTCQEDVQCLYKHRSFQDMVLRHQLSFKDWLSMELQIDAVNDVLKPMDRWRYVERSILSRYLPRPVSEGGCGGDVISCMSTICDVILHSGINMLRGTYLSCDQHCTQFQSPGGSTSDLLLLVQKLVCLQRNSQITHNPWLTSYVLQKILEKNMENNSLCSSQEVVNFFSLMTQLPAHLLLCNSLTHLPELSPDGTTGLVSLINDHWKDNITNGVVLSLECTGHLLQALLYCCAENPSMTDFLEEQCPCLLPSFLYHWASLSYLVNLWLDLPQSSVKLITYPTTLHQDVQQMISGGLKLEDCMELTKAWHLGLVLASNIIHRSDIRVDIEQVFVAWLNHSLTSYDVVLSCLLCLLAYLGWLSLHQMEEDSQMCGLIQRLWMAEPKLLSDSVDTFSSLMNNNCSEEMPPLSILVQVLPSLSRKLAPSVCCRLLILMKVNEVVTMVTRSAILPSILRVYVDCTTLYDTMSSGTHTILGQPVTLNDLQTVSSLIQSVIQHAPNTQLANTPKILMSQCDVDIQRTYATALRRGDTHC